MKQLYGGVLFIILVNITIAQNDSTIYRIYQIKGTEDTIANQFSKLNISYKTDTAYVFLLPPAGCPRCEGVINPIIEKLNAKGVRADILIWAIYPKYKAASKYLERRHFLAPNQYVFPSKLLNHFKILPIGLKVPFLCKFNVKTGDMLYATPLLGARVDSSFIATFTQTNTVYHKKNIDDTILSEQRTLQTIKNSTYLKEHKKVYLQEHSEYPISEAISVACSPNFRYLGLNDHLGGNMVYIFDVRDGKFKTAIQPVEDEMKRYIQAPDTIFQLLKRYNILNIMYFSLAFKNDSIFYLTASLPEVILDSNGNVEYNNQSCMMAKSIGDNYPSKITEFEDIKNNFVSSHTKAIFSFDHNFIFLPLKKGWPVIGTTIINPADTTLKQINPFISSFYDTAYAFAVYDTNGSFITYFGQLDRNFKKLKLGYFGFHPNIKIIDDKIYYTSSVNGVIYIYESVYSSLPADSIVVFETSSSSSSSSIAINYLTEPLRYITETYNYAFKKRIVDYGIQKGILFVIVKENDNETYYLLKQNIFSGAKEKFYIPDILDDSELNNISLLNVSGKIKLVGIYSTFDSTYLIDFKLP